MRIRLSRNFILCDIDWMKVQKTRVFIYCLFETASKYHAPFDRFSNRHTYSIRFTCDTILFMHFSTLFTSLVKLAACRKNKTVEERRKKSECYDFAQFNGMMFLHVVKNGICLLHHLTSYQTICKSNKPLFDDALAAQRKTKSKTHLILDQWKKMRWEIELQRHVVYGYFFSMRMF